MTSAVRSRNRRAPPNEQNLIIALAAAVGLLIPGQLALTATAWAEPATDEPSKQGKEIDEHRVISVTISKGETYTIRGVEKDAKIDSKTVKNPDSLTIQPQSSGDTVLLGTEGGSWEINATLATMPNGFVNHLSLGETSACVAAAPGFARSSRADARRIGSRRDPRDGKYRCTRSSRAAEAADASARRQGDPRA
jgi:hypothetical protein